MVILIACRWVERRGRLRRMVRMEFLAMRPCGWADRRGLFGWLNLNVDRVGITYGNGQSLGGPPSPVQLSSSIGGDRPIPARAMPRVVARVGVGLDPVDVTGADDARWLRACLWPDQPERVARLGIASSAWRYPTGRLCASRPLAVAGRRATSWRGWGRLLVLFPPDASSGGSKP